ncbi:MAG TPA: carboxypeptidase-like regulatory domain-containing protein, partial [Verrucomicrobiae bacterium]|nr:carboxypeptidase-like regulatory domain-containing protein [Verrucomicrobiae bacterium]
MVRTVHRTLSALIAAAAILGPALCAHAQSKPAAPAPASAAKPAAAPSAAPAGASGRVTGRALEKGHEPVPFANVIILGTKQGTMTDETGAFVIAGVPVG